MPVRTRFAPSPSGPLHLGGARTALFAWLEAKARGGSFVLRFEDTDASRSSKEYADRIAVALQWLGISIDQGPFYQRQHGERHREVAAALLAAGHAYRCYCSQEEITEMRNQAKAQGLKPRYDGRCRNRAKPGDGSHVIRFCTPASGTINIEDKVQGNITFANEELDDLVIIRADGSATYHLAVVVDDHDIGVTDVTRGADHLNNTPRQIHIIDAIGAARPSYAHLPLLLGAGGKPMSKRDSAADILGYRDQGFLATAMINFLARLGWSHGDQELFSMQQLQQLFSLDRVNRAAASCDLDKLRWFNQQHLLQLPPEQQAQHLAGHLAAIGITAGAPGPAVEQLLQQLASRHVTFAEMAEAAVVYYHDPELDPQQVQKHLTPEILPLLEELMAQLQLLQQWQQQQLHQCMQQIVEQHGIKFGKLAQAVRVAIIGRAVSPPIDATLELVGRDSVLRRLQNALQNLRQ